MNDNFFVDTNVFIYFIEHTSEKQLISKKIVYTALQKGSGIISTQVIQEFLNIATGKIQVPIKKEDTLMIMQSILFPLCHIYPDYELYFEALDIKSETHYSFYDSLILAAALRGGCNILYSEDLQSGQMVRGLEIINPYLSNSKLPQ